MLKKIKTGWKKSSEDLAGTALFWQRSAAGVALFSTIQTLLKTYARGKILDAGAGTLTWKPFITNYAQEYVSIDFAKTHPDLSIVGSIEDMPLPDNNFDTIVCIQVLEHVPHPWLAMQEFSRVLKPEGTLILSIPHFSYLHNEPFDFFRYTNHGLRSLAQDAGLNVISITPIGGLCTFLQHSFATAATGLAYGIPILWPLALAVVQATNHLALELDKLLDARHLFPLKYAMVAKK